LALAGRYEMADTTFDFSSLQPAFVGGGQITAQLAGASPVVAAGDLVPIQAPPNSTDLFVFVGGGHLLTSSNSLLAGGALNPSNNPFNPAGH
jgi:hypothetical protein